MVGEHLRTVLLAMNGGILTLDICELLCEHLQLQVFAGDLVFKQLDFLSKLGNLELM